MTPTRPSRPPFVDLLVIVAIVGLVGALVVLQATIGGGRGEDAVDTARERNSGGPVVHSSLGPSPSPSSSAAVPSSPAASVAPSPSAPPPTQQVAPQASALASAAQSAAVESTSFRVATFNVLGASHTRPRGDSRNKRSYQERTPYAVQLLEQHRVDVVGLQEFESPQARLFDQLTGARWDLFPAPGSNAADGRRSIAWRTDRWELVDAGSVAVPYFGGSTVQSPVVLLRYRATGRSVWFLNVHNPASGCAVCGGSNDRWRAEALQREIVAISKLNADGTPVVFTGDMNAREAFFCTIAAAIPVVFANGGSYGAGGCLPPRPTPIDWIVGTPQLAFSDFVTDRGPLNRMASDHAIVAATAHLVD